MAEKDAYVAIHLSYYELYYCVSVGLKYVWQNNMQCKWKPLSLFMLRNKTICDAISKPDNTDTRYCAGCCIKDPVDKVTDYWYYKDWLVTTPIYIHVYVYQKGNPFKDSPFYFQKIICQWL